MLQFFIELFWWAYYRKTRDLLSPYFWGGVGDPDRERRYLMAMRLAGKRIKKEGKS
jgi:hypothetical protein